MRAEPPKPEIRSTAPTRGKRVPRAIREQQMLDAAIRVFAAHGYRSASMDAIAREAATSKPMLYLYYGSKEELYAACVTRETGRLMQALEQQIAPDDTPRERLEKVISSFLTFVAASADSWNVVYRQAAAEPTFRSSVDASRTMFVELTADLLERTTQSPRPRSETMILATALVGAGESVADRVAARAIGRDEAIAMLAQLAWTGLSGPRH